MIRYKQEDVVLVEFGFSEGTGSKKRPALVISSNEYQKGRQEVIIAAITSNVDRVLFGDTKIDEWKEAGLLYPSVITGIIRTVKSNVVFRTLGRLTKKDFQKVQKNLKKALAL